MEFDDVQTRPWPPGAIAMWVTAGLLVVAEVTKLLLFSAGVGLVMFNQPPTMAPSELAMALAFMGVFWLLPAVLNLGLAGANAMAARTLRERGLGPLPLLVAVATLVGCMFSVMMFCLISPCIGVPLNVIPLVGSIVSLILVAADRHSVT
jgi:hypothetical protein